VGGGIGMMLFDDLATYYATAEDVPAGFVEATDCLYSVYNPLIMMICILKLQICCYS